MPNIFQKVDSFGHPIGLTFHGNQTYKTTFGGLVTMLSVLGLFTYFLILLYTVANHGKSTITNSEYIRDLVWDTNKVNYTLDNFDLSVKLVYIKPTVNPPVVDEIQTYFSIQVQRETIYYNPNPQPGEHPMTYTLTDVTMEPCGYGRLKLDNASYELLAGNTTWCPSTTEFPISIAGGLASKNGSRLLVNIVYCNQAVLDTIYPNLTCKSTNESDAIASYTQLYSSFMQEYFDVSDFVKPIKSTLNSLQWAMSPGRAQNAYFNVGQHYAVLKDSMFLSSLNNTNNSYTAIVRYQDVYGAQTSTLPWFISIIFLMDDHVRTTERRAFTVMDSFSVIGGFMGLLFLLVGVLIKKFQEFLYYQEVIRKNFLCENDEADSSDLLKRASGQIQDPNNNSGDEKQNAVGPRFGLFDRSQSNRSSRKLKKKTPRDKKDTPDGDIYTFSESLYLYALTRIPFFFKFKEFIQMKMLCQNGKNNKRVRLFNLGVQKIKQSFEIPHVVKVFQNMDLLMPVIFSQYQRNLLPYVKQNQLDQEDDPNQIDDDEEMGDNFDQRIRRSIMKILASNPEKIDKRFLENILVKQPKDMDKEFKEIDNRSTLRKKRTGLKIEVNKAPAEKMEKFDKFDKFDQIDSPIKRGGQARQNQYICPDSFGEDVEKHEAKPKKQITTRKLRTAVERNDFKSSISKRRTQIVVVSD